MATASYCIHGEGDCVGRWANGTTHIVDVSEKIQPFDLCVVTAADHLADVVKDQTGYESAAKIFLGRDGDSVILATLNPPEAVTIPLENVGALHRINDVFGLLLLRQDEKLALGQVSQFATDEGIDPIGPEWRPSGAAVQQLNYIRLLGGMTIAAIPDMARPIKRYGLTSTFRSGFAPLVRNFKATRIAAKEVKKAGAALDMVLDTRARSIADLFDDWQRGSKFERALEGASSRFGLVSLMAPWNAAMKQFVGTIAMDETLRAAKAVVAGNATRKQISRLAENGIDEALAKRIWGQFENGGGSVERGLHLPNTEDWVDRKAIEALRAAIVREADNVIVTPGLELPLWMSTPLGKMLGQFKSFAMASTQKILIAGLQQKDAAFLSGVVLSLGLGALSTWLYTLASARDTSNWSLAKWGTEAVDRSGLLTIFSEANNIAEKVSRGRVGLSAFTGEMASRYQSRNAAGAMLGPSFGLATDALSATGSAFAGDWGASDSRAVRRIMPYQNLFYLRRLLDQVEGGVNDAFGVPQRKQ